MSKDKKKDSKKAKSQGEVVTEAMANVTGNAEAAKAALKAGKKLAKERIQLEDPILSLSAPRPVEIVEPQEPQRSVLTAYDKPSKKKRAAEQAAGDLHAPEWDGNVPLPQNPGESTHTLTNNGGVITVTHMGDSELTPESMATEPNEPLAEVTTEAQGGVPSSAEPRTRTDNLLVLLKQAQESADLDNLTQTVECPRKYVTKNYGVQLVKKYAPEGINAEATEDIFVPPDRDHPKGMWQVTLRIKPKAPTTASISKGPDVGGFEIHPGGVLGRDRGATWIVGTPKEEEVVSTSDLPKPETQSLDKQIAKKIKQKVVKPAKAGKKKGKK